MARLNTRASSSDIEQVDTSTSSIERGQISSATPESEIGSYGSDKENQNTSRSNGKSRKRTSDTAPMSEQRDSSRSGNKRRRIDERPKPVSRAALREELDARGQKEFYDPDQDEDQKRATKKSLRDLTARVIDSRSEFLQANNTGIEDTLREADELYKNVKQTSVATIDSRLLVTVGDLASRKAKAITLGDASTGVDLDDFVTKCIAFMKRGESSAVNATQATQSSSTQRRRRRQADHGGDDDDEDGEAMNWSYLGQNACFLYNARPCLTGFLLGPLSVQKKVRQQTQRRAKETQASSTQALRPTELGAKDLEKQESANLTVICGEIARLLDQTITRGEKKVEEEFESIGGENASQEALEALMIKHNLADNGCVPLFRFFVNPKSFGQTVENMFYVSFLIKEGRVGLDFDSKGWPTLGVAEQKTVKERQESQRNQAVFTLDFDVWADLVANFGIKKSVIPHRIEEQWDDGTIV